MKKSWAQKQIAKRKREKSCEGFWEIPGSQWPAVGGNPNRNRVWLNDSFMVQEFNEGEGVFRLTINRVTRDGSMWHQGITWDELQAIKNNLGYRDACAVEIFPPADQLVCVANMRHLWVLPEPPEYMWRNN